MSTQAAIYVRISDDREGAGLGVERQEKDCRAVADRLGWTVTEVYTDNDLSAYNRRKPRPGYLRLLTDIRAGHRDGLIAWHNDRLHRSARELEDFIDIVQAAGIDIQTVKAGKYDLSTPTGRMQARIAGAVAQHESEHKAERNRAKARELADAGRIGNGGPQPFGYQSDRLTVDPVEAAVVQDVYADVLAGKALRSIARDLQQRGIKTTTGREWTVQALRYTLLRARNMGWREHHGRLAAPAVWEPIVSRETWEQAKTILTSPDRPNVGRPMYARRYLLAGFLRCGLCGSKLVPSRNADLQRFACRPEPGTPRCGKILIRYEPLEAFVVEAVLRRSETVIPDEAPDPTDSLRAQVGQLEARLEALGDAFADDGGDLLEFRRAGQRLRERIADLRRQINEHATVTRRRQPGGIREQWDGYDLDQRRGAVAELLERVEVGPGKVGLNRFDPDRLTLVWR
jgi:site-specific DNA recombinase